MLISDQFSGQKAKNDAENIVVDVILKKNLSRKLVKVKTENLNIYFIFVNLLIKIIFIFCG
jgi:hypothetical protein